jgi:hypothetical protein
MATLGVVPVSDGASSLLKRQEKYALWQVFFTAAPAPNVKLCFPNLLGISRQSAPRLLRIVPCKPAHRWVEKARVLYNVS